MEMSKSEKFKFSLSKGAPFERDSHGKGKVLFSWLLPRLVRLPPGEAQTEPQNAITALFVCIKAGQGNQNIFIFYIVRARSIALA